MPEKTRSVEAVILEFLKMRAAYARKTAASEGRHGQAKRVENFWESTLKDLAENRSRPGPSVLSRDRPAARHLLDLAQRHRPKEMGKQEVADAAQSDEGEENQSAQPKRMAVGEDGRSEIEATEENGAHREARRDNARQPAAQALIGGEMTEAGKRHAEHGRIDHDRET